MEIWCGISCHFETTTSSQWFLIYGLTAILLINLLTTLLYMIYTIISKLAASASDLEYNLYLCARAFSLQLVSGVYTDW
jgi:hypothetical protein